MEEDDFAGAKELIRDTVGKPRYIPARNEFLKYAEWNYYENTKQLIDLSKFLMNKCNVPGYVINPLMYDLHREFAEDLSMQSYFDVLDKYNVIIDEKYLNKLVILFTDCCNNTRLWGNKGYTPNELIKIYAATKKKTVKIGRNEPCPCGSGKKYKKCCGR